MTCDDSRPPSPVRIEEHEPEFDESRVVLDWYNSDLSLVIDTETRCSATPLSTEGFGFIWSGARATHGFNAGKVCFEAKVVRRGPPRSAAPARLSAGHDSVARRRCYYVISGAFSLFMFLLVSIV